MRRHAGAEIEGDAVEMIAGPRRAVAAALLQAGDMRIAKIPAARTLREIAAERGEVADLRRGETQCRRRDAGIGCIEAGVGCDRGDAGEGADAGCAVGAPVHADRTGRGHKIDQRPLRDAAAPPFGKVGAGGAEFGAERSWLRWSCCGPPFQGGNETVGPDRNFRQPDAGGVARLRWPMPARSAPWPPRRSRRCRRARGRSRPRRNARRYQWRVGDIPGCDNPPCRR